ncbi:MAG: glutathione S-transferase family protein [Pseudomonadota bacterium]
MTMTLYFAPKTIAVASALALLEAGADFRLETVDFAQAAQRSREFLAVNPKGRVPALQTPNGILTETSAILEYAAPGLVPDDTWEAARMREIMTYLATTMHVAHAHKMRGHRWAVSNSSWADMRGKVAENMAESAAYLSSKITGPFALGDVLSLADPYIYAVTSWLEGDGVPMADFPKIAALRKEMEARPSFTAASRMGVFT